MVNSTVLSLVFSLEVQNRSTHDIVDLLLHCPFIKRDVSSDLDLSCSFGSWFYHLVSCCLPPKLHKCTAQNNTVVWICG